MPRSTDDGGAEEGSVIDHLGLRVRDVEKSRAFYEKALAPLGYRVLMDFGLAVGLGGPDGRPDFWLGRLESKRQVESHCRHHIDPENLHRRHASRLHEQDQHERHHRQVPRPDDGVPPTQPQAPKNEGVHGDGQ